MSNRIMGYARVSSHEQNLDRQIIALKAYVPEENILIEVLASIAEQERATIRKRQREGIDAARLKGRHLGRPMSVRPDSFELIYGEWKRGRITAKKAMQKLGLSNATFYRMVRQYENESKG